MVHPWCRLLVSLPTWFSISQGSFYHSFYAPAQNACAGSHKRLRKLKLLEDEQELVQSSVQPKDIVSKLLQIQAEQHAKASSGTSTGKATSSFVNSFCTFANSISNVVTVLLPQSPEYTVTFGLLFLLFKVRTTPQSSRLCRLYPSK